MSTILSNIFTGKDNVTHDLGKYSWVFSLFLLLVVVVYRMIMKQEITITEISGGASAIATTHAASLWIKKDQ